MDIRKDNMKLTTNFSKHEFDCSDGSEMPDNILANIRVLASYFQVIRDTIGVRIDVNSSYRSMQFNRSIGSKDTSQHVTGKAADLSVNSITPEHLYDVIEYLIEWDFIPEGGLGLYDTFVHYDIRGYKARWDNRKTE